MSNPNNLDGTAQSVSSTAQTIVFSTFSTTYSGDLLIVAAQVGAIGTSNTVASISDTSNLTWTKQAAQLWETANARELSIWTAPASSSAPYSGTVTVTLTSAVSYTGRAFLTAISNPNSTILDPNASNPATSTNTASVQTISETISTNNPNDILIGFICSNVALGTVTRPSGFNQIVAGGTASDFSYNIVSSTLSSVTETWTYTGVAAQNAGILIALQFAPPSIDDWLPQFPDKLSNAQKQVVEPNNVILRVPSTVTVSNWKSEFTDVIPPNVLKNNFGVITNILGIFNTETINIDKWKPEFTDSIIKPPRVREAGFNVDVQYNQTGYTYIRSITINHLKVSTVNSTNLSSFPMLIYGTFSYLATVANGGFIQNTVTLNSQTVPADLIFTSDVNGVSLLDWEVASYTSTTGQIEIWINIPFLSSSVDTKIYMWYGNSSVTTYQCTATNTWDTNYSLVMHMANGTTLSMTNSISSNIGTNSNCTASSGQINGAASFNGSTSNIGSFTTNVSSSGNSRTISAWVNANNLSGSGTILTASQFTFRLETTKVNYFHSGGSSVNTTTGISSGNWIYVVATLDATGHIGKIYTGGVLRNTTSSFSTETAGGANGEIGGGSGNLNGFLDELHVSNGIVRSADWIVTEYNNQNSPSSFYSISAENSIVSPMWQSLYVDNINKLIPHRDEGTHTWEVGSFNKETITLDKYNSQFPDKIQLLPYKHNTSTITVPLGIFNIEIAQLDKWLTNYIDSIQKLLPYRNEGINTWEVSVFNKETVGLDKWKPEFTDKLPPLIIRHNSGIISIPLGIFNKETLSIDKWLGISIDSIDKLIPHRDDGTTTWEVSIFNSENINLDKFKPEFVDKLPPTILASNSGITTSLLGIVTNQLVNLDEWNPNFPSVSIEKLTPHRDEGTHTWETGVFNIESINLDKFNAEFPSNTQQKRPNISDESFLSYPFTDVKTAHWLSIFPNSIPLQKYNIINDNPLSFFVSIATLAHWIPNFIDKIYNIGSQKEGFSIINLLNVTETINLDKWKSEFPDIALERLIPHRDEGIHTWEVGIFDAESINLDKWLPNFINKIQTISSKIEGYLSWPIGQFSSVTFDKWGPEFIDKVPSLLIKNNQHIITWPITVFGEINMSKWLPQFTDYINRLSHPIQDGIYQFNLSTIIVSGGIIYFCPNDLFNHIS